MTAASDRHTPQALIATALAALDAGRPADARASLEAARDLNPHHSQVHYLLAECALRLGQPGAALEAVGRSLGWDRTRPEPFALAGRLLHLDGDSAAGAALLERALALAPAYGPARVWLREARRQPQTGVAHPAFEPLTRPLRVSLSMIVKNEALHLGRCLEAARRHVDEIAIVDTGSADATVAIALAYGAKVASFTWCDDFAAARNASLALATGDWVLVLDADEVLEAPAGYMRRLADTLPIPGLTGVAPLVSVTLHNHLQSIISADRWETQVINRLFWREAMAFRGEGHETPELLPGQGAELTTFSAPPLVVHHFGYRPELMVGREKLKRNIALLRQRAEAEPETAGVFYLLGRELVLDGQHEQGFEALERYWALWPADQRERGFRMAYFLQADALGARGRHEEALALLDRALAFDPEYPSYWFQKGEELGALGRHAEAVGCYEQAIAHADYAERHGIQPHNSFAPQHAGSLAHQRLARARALAAGETPAAPGRGEGASGRIAEALACLDEGQLDRAEALLEEAGRLAPGHSQVPYLRAEIALRRVDVPQALAWAWASLRLDARMAEPWALAGYLLHEDGDSALGRAFLERAVALAPGHWSARRLLEQVMACPRDSFAHPEIAAWFQGLTIRG